MTFFLFDDPRLTVLIIFYLLCSLAALLLTISHKPPPLSVTHPARTLRAVLLFILLEIISLAALSYAEMRLPNRAFAVLQDAWAMIFFVGIPALLLARGWWRWPVAFTRPNWRLIYIVPLVVLLADFMAKAQAPGPVDAWRPTMIVIVATTTLAAFGEEVIFRGMLLTHLRVALGSPAAALLASAAVFTLTHVPAIVRTPPETLGRALMVVFVLALFLGVLWLRTRSLLVTGLVHTALNLRPYLADAAAAAA